MDPLNGIPNTSPITRVGRLNENKTGSQSSVVGGESSYLRGNLSVSMESGRKNLLIFRGEGELHRRYNKESSVTHATASTTAQVREAAL